MSYLLSVEQGSFPEKGFDVAATANALVDRHFTNDLIPVLLLQCQQLLLLDGNELGQRVLDLNEVYV